jgi:hypothetical protein
MPRVQLPQRKGRAGWPALRTGIPAAVLLVLSTPVATWWLIGDQSTVPAGAEPDYAIRPWNISPAAAGTAGITSLLLATAMTVLIARATALRKLDRRWWAVLIPLLVAGILAGAGWRVMTAGGIGANIGAGLYVMFVGPIFAGLVAWAVAATVYLVAHPARRPAPMRRR